MKVFEKNFIFFSKILAQDRSLPYLCHTNQLKNTKMIRVEIENKPKNISKFAEHLFNQTILTRWDNLLTTIKAAESRGELEFYFKNRTEPYFFFYFGGSHFAVHQKDETGYIYKERLLLVKFQY